MKVYVSPDRRWRVEVADDGRCRIYQGGSLAKRTVSLQAAADWLVTRGVQELQED